MKSVADVQMLGMPIGAKIVHCMLQGQHACLWAEIDTDEKENELREFVILPTGADCGKWYGTTRYIGTVHTINGDFVFHVFELEEQD
jgi:hypothetical protein